MISVVRGAIATILAQALQPPLVRWDRPPAGTLRRGVLAVYSPRVLVVLVALAVAAGVGAVVWRRVRRPR